MVFAFVKRQKVVRALKTEWQARTQCCKTVLEFQLCPFVPDHAP